MTGKTTLNCYLCQEDFDVFADNVSLRTYLLVKNDINICGSQEKSDCEGMLNKKYGKNPKRNHDALAPASLWFEKKNVSTGFFSSEEKRVIVEPLLGELTNNLDNFRAEVSRGGFIQQEEIEKAKKEHDEGTKLWPKVSTRIEKRWNDILTELLEKIGGKVTLNDLHKYFFHDAFKTAAMIEKTDDGKKLSKKLDDLTQEFIEYDISYMLYDIDSLSGYPVQKLVDPHLCLYIWDINADKNGRMVDSYMSEEDIFTFHLEELVFDLDCKIKKTGNGRYYLKK